MTHGPGDEQRPRQYFPSERPQHTTFDYDPGYGYQEPEEPAPARERGGTAVIVLSVLFVLALLGAGVLFFLWRGAVDEANQPPPPPVTQTVTTTQQETVTETQGPSNPLPTQLPTEIPTEVPDIDVEGWFNDLLGERAPAQ